MDKLAEGESAPRQGPLAAAPSLAVQFFLIPLAVVGVLVMVYLGFRMLIEDQRTAQEYLHDVQYGGRERRWPAAYELSRLMVAPGAEAADPTIGPALVQAFEDAAGDDPRVRRYLALAIGRLEQPPAAAVPALLAAIDDPDGEVAVSAVWALGAIGDPAAVPGLSVIYGSTDPGLRKVTVYALGAIAGTSQIGTLRLALEDPVADVQWNAAVALARHRDASGVTVLRRMLDREYVARQVTRIGRETEEADPVADVIISGLRAVGALGEASLRDSVAALSRDDTSVQVRTVALETLERLNGDRPRS
jgi:HEAT repeat protein